MGQGVCSQVEALIQEHIHPPPEVTPPHSPTDAHHREDDARREKNLSRGDDMEGFFVEEADSGEETGVQADGSKRRRVGKGRFGGGSSQPGLPYGAYAWYVGGGPGHLQAEHGVAWR